MAQEIKFQWVFNRLDDDTTEITINDYIAQKQNYNWWTDEKGTEVTPKDFIEQLENSNSKHFDIIFNSGGGEVFAAQQIATAIKKKKQAGCKFTAKIESVCASAAVQIAMACDTVEITKGGYIMIHDPMVYYWGYLNATEAQEVAAQLTAIKNGIVDEYAEKTKLPKDEIIELMAKTTWLYGEDAVNKGFADKIMLSTEQPATITNKIVNVVENMSHGTVAATLNLPETLKSVLNNNQKTNITDKGENETMEIKNAAELTAKYPEFVNELTNSAVENAVQAERDRMKAIDAMQGKVSNEILNKAKYETFATAEKVALDAITNGDFVNTTVLNAMAKDATAVNSVDGTVAETMTGAEETKSAEAKEKSDLFAAVDKIVEKHKK